jgi:hypothetical protein
MTRRRGSALLAAMAACVIVVAAGASWACTAFMQLSGPTQVTALSEVTIRGTGLGSDKAVELRWNGAKGSVLATVRTDVSGTFSTPIAVPDVAPGVYYLFASAEGVTPARKALQVTPAFGAGALASANVTTGPARATAAADSLAGGAASPASSMAIGLQVLAGGLALAVIGFLAVTVRAGRRAPALAEGSRRRPGVS